MKTFKNIKIAIVTILFASTFFACVKNSDDLLKSNSLNKDLTNAPLDEIFDNDFTTVEATLNRTLCDVGLDYSSFTTDSSFISTNCTELSKLSIQNQTNLISKITEIVKNKINSHGGNKKPFTIDVVEPGTDANSIASMVKVYIKIGSYETKSLGKVNAPTDPCAMDDASINYVAAANKMNYRYKFCDAIPIQKGYATELYSVNYNGISSFGIGKIFAGSSTEISKSDFEKFNISTKKFLRDAPSLDSSIPKNSDQTNKTFVEFTFKITPRAVFDPLFGNTYLHESIGTQYGKFKGLDN